METETLNQEDDTKEDELKETNGNLLDFETNLVYKLQKYITRFCVEMKKIKIFEAEEGCTDINKLLNFLVIETDNIYIRKCIDFIYESLQLMLNRKEKYNNIISTNNKNIKFYPELFELIENYHRSIDFYELGEDDYEHAEILDYSLINYEDEYEKYLKCLRDNMGFSKLKISSPSEYLSILNELFDTIDDDFNHILDTASINRSVRISNNCCDVIIEYLALIYFSFSYVSYE